LGINTRGALLIGGINSTLTIFYCIIFLLILDRVGRIRPLMVSAAFLAATLFINAVMSSFMDPENHNQLRAFVAMNFLFSLFFIPTGVISWVYPAEIFPVEVRALGNASSTFTNWIINLVVAQFTPHALSKIGMRYLFVFVATNLVALTCYAVFYPETTNISLEAMHKLFGDKVLLEDESGNGERVSDDDGREKERTVHRTEKV
jgi:MFS family permease